MATGRGRQLSLGRIAGIPVYVSPTWFLVAGLITIWGRDSVLGYLPQLSDGEAYAISFLFAVLLYASVFVHELGHALTARRLGLPVRGVTLHFLGGHTEIERDAPTPGRDLVVSAAGPLLSLALGGLGLLAYLAIDDDSVPGFLVYMLAAANLVVGVFNVLPGLPLDGGHMLRAAVWRVTGDEHRGTVVAARSGQVLAGLVLLLPFALDGARPDVLTIVWAGLVAALLWSGASQALAVGRMRARLPRLDTRTLARRAAPVAPDLPVSEALRRAREADVTSLVVVDSAGRPTGLVNEAAVAAIPEQRRPWVTIGDSAKSLRQGMVLDLDVRGDALLKAMRETPASEYLVVDAQGRVYGVLVSSDVDHALAAR
ncbi:CBS domain-containing protein [Jiangella ureilytica]|uniref:Zinc metalloprotease n=1 Tax=Jiangella ureilytica TaxID=2530374 RepID=A0A4R4RRQ8_9ACTN|nr:site-2 protease family protein [Jiangella ureilytica]TDC52550.1 CBS domain-containing protein [Jiangella ureilytica]